MSLADHFEPIADPGFYQTVKPETARRQFNMSVGLVVILATVAIVVGSTAGFGRVQQVAQDSAVQPVRLVVQAPQLVHIRHAEEGTTRTPGG
jgi:hypothetical protein